MSTKSEIMEPTYDAFISYSRTDKSFVEKLAKRLERFSPPKALGLPSRRLRIFVDTKDLVGTSYYEAVEKALIEARKLIVVCSPASRNSQYVEDEITRFLKSGEKTGKDIIPILLEGIPNNEARTPEDETLKAFPDVFYNQMEMPLAVDYSRFDLRVNKLDKDGYVNSWYVLLANILEVKRNELEERDAKRRRQRQLILSAITSVVITILTITTIIALWQRHEAVEQRQRAYAQQLAAQAQLNLSEITAKPHKGIKQAIASMQLASTHEAVEALKTGIFRLPPTHITQLASDESETIPLSFSPNSEWIVGASDNDLRIWRTENGESIFSQTLRGKKQLLGFTEDSKFALLTQKTKDETMTSEQLILLDMQDSGDKPKTRIHSFPRILNALVAGNGVFALVSDSTGKRITAHDILSGETMGELELDASAVLGALDETTGESVIVDTSGKVHFLGYGFQTRKVAFELPKGDQALALSLKSSSSPEESMGMPMMPWTIMPWTIKADRKVLITRRESVGLIIYSIQNGRTIRKLDAEQANVFVEFIAEGALFAASGTKSGPNIFTFEGEYITTITHSRAKDWDINRMGKIGRQIPILDIRASKDRRTIVTARKDGRISVWRPGAKPRYGAWGSPPMPELENIAHFDHGQELGETVTWSGPPVLSVSPDGRYIGSQSMGLETNPVGGIKSYNPLMRIWDVRQRKEIARFSPFGGMAMIFSPSRDLLLSISAHRPNFGDSKVNAKGYRLDVWKLSPYPFEQDRLSKTTRHTIQITDMGKSPSEYKNRITFAANGQRAVWIDGSLKMWVWDKSSGEAETLETLTPIIESLFRKQAKQLVKRGAPFMDKTFDADEKLKTWIKTMAENPAMIPSLLPIKISDDSYRALLAIGTSLRLYDLSSKQMLMERNIEDLHMLNNILLSANGKYFAVSGATWESYEAARKQKKQGRKESNRPEIEIRVYAVDKEEPLKTLTFSIFPNNLPTPMPSVIPLAIGPEGRFLVVDKLYIPFESDSTVLPSKKVTVIDIVSGQSSLELFTEPFAPPHPTDFVEKLKTKMVAFSADGRFIAIRRTEPVCPTSTVTNPMTWMTMLVPTCPDMRVKYTVWTLQTQQRAFEIEDIVESDFNNVFLTTPKSIIPPAASKPSEWTRRTQRNLTETDHANKGSDRLKTKAAGSSAYEKSMDTDDKSVSKSESKRMAEEHAKALQFGRFNMLGISGAAPSDQVAFTVNDKNSVKVTRVELDPDSGGMTLITENLGSMQKMYVEEACRRMEPEHREFSPEQWALQFPGADFHSICASTFTHQ